MLRIAGTKSFSLNNGDGVRFVVFVQGCAHHCKGCHNPETWDFNGGRGIDVRELAAEIKAHPYIDGLTLSGGDPFYQEQECVELLKLLPGMNVWVYTGFEYEDIVDHELTQMADVIVCGPYVEALRCEGRHYGSSNQRIIKVKGDNQQPEIRRLADELAEISLELHRSAALTDNAVRRIKSKLEYGTPDDKDWSVLIGQLYVQCMNSKNALSYHRLIDREYAAWNKLCDITHAFEEGGKNEKPD